MALTPTELLTRLLAKRTAEAALKPVEEKPVIVQKLIALNEERKSPIDRAIDNVHKLASSFPLHYTTNFRELIVDVENRRNSFRRGVDGDGKPWSTKMKNPYGEIRDTMGVDGDPVDCFLGPDKKSDFVLVVHTKVKGTKNKYDEDKVVLGAKNREEAMKIFRSHYDNWREHYLSSTPMTLYDLKEKLKRTKKKPRRLDKHASISDDDLKSLAYTKGWEWDDDPRFLDLVENLTGESSMRMIDSAQRGDLFSRLLEDE